jgi:GNAT superfamily N-acetyltransferase
LPEGFFLARDGTEYVGMTILDRRAGLDALHQGITGVRPSHGRRGIATALKVRAIGYARELGYRELHTENNPRNAAMLRVNQALGFRRTAVMIRFEKALAGIAAWAEARGPGSVGGDRLPRRLGATRRTGGPAPAPIPAVTASRNGASHLRHARARTDGPSTYAHRRHAGPGRRGGRRPPTRADSPGTACGSGAAPCASTGSVGMANRPANATAANRPKSIRRRIVRTVRSFWPRALVHADGPATGASHGHAVALI